MKIFDVLLCNVQFTSYHFVIAVCVVGYLLASGAPIEGLNMETPPSEQTLKLTDTALIITYLMLAASIIVILGGGLKTIIQNKK